MTSEARGCAPGSGGGVASPSRSSPLPNQMPSGGGDIPPVSSLVAGTSPAVAQSAVGGFSGREPHLTARFPNVSPERRLMLLRVEALYAMYMTMREVSEATGLNAKALDNIRQQWRLTSLPEARKRAQQMARARQGAMRFSADAEALRDFVARNRCTVADAGRGLGWGRGKAKDIARRYGIKAPASVVMAARDISNKARSAAAAEKQRTTSKRAPPNPRQSPAHQAQTARFRASTWMQGGGAKVRIPPPANAEELIRQALAEGRVTKCPTMCAAPVNNGRGVA